MPSALDKANSLNEQCKAAEDKYEAMRLKRAEAKANGDSYSNGPLRRAASDLLALRLEARKASVDAGIRDPHNAAKADNNVPEGGK